MPKYPKPSSRKPAKVDRGGRPRKDRAIQEVRVSEEIHDIAKKQVQKFNTDRLLTHSTEPALSIVDYVGNAVDAWMNEYSENPLLALPVINRLKQWRHPWNYIYIDLEIYQRMKTYCKPIEEAMPPESRSRLKYGVNASNLISAIILFDAQMAGKLQRTKEIDKVQE